MSLPALWFLPNHPNLDLNKCGTQVCTLNPSSQLDDLAVWHSGLERNNPCFFKAL